VRSHIYTIRKKLDSYYANDGSNNHIRCIIPKGQYHVTFRKASKFTARLRTGSFLNIVWACIVALCIGLVFVLWSQNQNLKNNQIHTNNSIFIDFVESDLPTLIVVGDYYFYHIINSELAHISRRITINSDADLDSFIISNPEIAPHITKEDNSYIGQDIAYGLPPILYELFEIRSRLKIRLASKLSYNDLRENNIIYLGSLKALGILDNVMQDLAIQYELNPHRIFLIPAPNDTTQTFQVRGSFAENSEWTDYAIVAKLPGSNKNSILLISTFNSWDSGTTAKNIVDAKTTDAILSQFDNSPDKFPTYFEMLFEVNGYRRTSLNSRVLYVRPIKE
jgi:hypothetical protein